MQASSRAYNRFINVRVRTREDVGDECGVCLATFCDDEVCNKTAIQTTCCGQGICAACVSKLATRCTCTDECSQIIYMCPFCRTIARSSALDVFLGTKRPCKACKAAHDQDIAGPSPVQ